MNKSKYLFLLIFFLSAFFRFYKLDWGSGLFPHPDERNIAGAIMNLHFPQEMNPKFFAYGGFPIYLYYFTGYFLYLITHSPIFQNFDTYLLIGRYWSAFFSTITVFIFYLISRRFLSQRMALFASFLLALLPGVIQQAHFATVESLISFFLFLILFLTIRFWETKKYKYIFFAAIFLGLSTATKIVSLTFLPIVFLPILADFIKTIKMKIVETYLPRTEWYRGHGTSLQNNDSDTAVNIPLNELHSVETHCNVSLRKYILKNFIRTVFISFFLLCLTLTFYFLVSPYSILDWQDFRGSMDYETGVGTGRMQVFYTVQYINTLPAVFQFTKIFPYALGPAVLLFGTMGIFIFIVFLCRDLINQISTKSVDKSLFTFCLLLIAFCSYLIPNLFFFAKWTRFMAPIFPFFAFFAVYFIKSVIARSVSDEAIYLKIKIILVSLLIIPTLIWSFAFYSIYLRPDVRITATDWIMKNIPGNSYLLYETGNVIDVPLEGNYIRNSFDFYHIEENHTEQDLYEALEKADYFITASRRVWANFPRLPKKYPVVAKFYDLLWSEKLGFKKVADIDSFPAIDGFKINDEMAEETFTVFDHPHIMIWKKIANRGAAEFKKVITYE